MNKPAAKLKKFTKKTKNINIKNQIKDIMIDFIH